MHVHAPVFLPTCFCTLDANITKESSVCMPHISFRMTAIAVQIEGWCAFPDLCLFRLSFLLSRVEVN